LRLLENDDQSFFWRGPLFFVILKEYAGAPGAGINQKTMDQRKEWEWEIRGEEKWLAWNLGEIRQYKDLLLRFVRRDLLANYQQTVLGPFWILFQPVLTTLVYFVIFGRIAKISTDGSPAFLFYLPGIIIWNFFSDCLTGTMYTFLNNSAVFSKVYFPRLILPLSSIITHAIRLSVQLVLFFIIYLFYFFRGELGAPTGALLLLPLLILITAAFSLGGGLIVSVFTAKYRDLDYTLQFILRLFMFASPVVFPASIVPERYRILFWLNPLTPVIETFRAACLTHAPVLGGYLWVSVLSRSILLVLGISLFKRWDWGIMEII
jgi:lipopolysaccharide transport system permease protein